MCLSAVDRGQLTAILPVVCHHVQLSTYKLNTASVQSASVTDVDSMIKVRAGLFALIVGCFIIGPICFLARRRLVIVIRFLCCHLVVFLSASLYFSKRGAY